MYEYCLEFNPDRAWDSIFIYSQCEGYVTNRNGHKVGKVSWATGEAENGKWDRNGNLCKSLFPVPNLFQLPRYLGFLHCALHYSSFSVGSSGWLMDGI